MAGGSGSAEVDSGKSREDEGLQGGNKADLEDEEEEGQREGEGAKRGDAEQDGEPATHEEQQQVAGEDVGEESHGERDQAGEVRNRLDDEDEALGKGVHLLQAGRQPTGQVLEE